MNPVRSNKQKKKKKRIQTLFDIIAAINITIIIMKCLANDFLNIIAALFFVLACS